MPARTLAAIGKNTFEKTTDNEKHFAHFPPHTRHSMRITYAFLRPGEHLS